MPKYIPEEKSEDCNKDEIASILGKIDELVSVSVNKAQIAVNAAPLSKEAMEKRLQEEGFAEAQLNEITKGMASNLPTEIYAKKCYNWMQMREIRKGLFEDLNTSIYADPLFSAEQMREIRLGLVDKLDVTSYAKLMLSSTDMRKFRYILFNESYRHNKKQFGRYIEDPETGIALRISNDCMKAYLTIPENVKKELTLECLQQVLTEYNIIYGVSIKKLQKIITEHSYNQEICVATGKHAVDGKPGWYEIFFENSVEKGKTVAPDDEIDYSEVNVIDMVMPGKILAKYHPAEKDTEGRTVTNIPIGGIMNEELPPLNGVGFERNEQDNTYIAKEKGYASYDSTTGSLNVWNVYKINGDVSYYQSIEYDGTVLISGSVRNSAIIYAKGDVIIDGFVESAQVYSQQNIVIKSGVNGGGNGYIEAGGSVRGKFFENIAIKASGMIEGNYFLNCNINTDDRLIARGKKAKIMGGHVEAAIGVEASSICTYLSKKTFFNIGDTYSLNKRVADLEHNKKSISEELQQLIIGKQKLTMLMGDDPKNQSPLYKKTCDAIHTKELQYSECNKAISRLNAVIKRAEKAYVRVYSELHPNVTFTINGQRKKVEKKISKGILLTKEKNI